MLIFLEVAHINKILQKALNTECPFHKKHFPQKKLRNKLEMSWETGSENNNWLYNSPYLYLPKRRYSLNNNHGVGPLLRNFLTFRLIYVRAGPRMEISQNVIFSPPPSPLHWRCVKKSTANRNMCEITTCQDLLGLGPPNALAPWIWALQAQSQVGLDAKCSAPWVWPT